MTDFVDRSLDGATLHLAADFAPRATADEWLERLLADVAWRTEELVLFGRARAVPRLVAWEGEPGARYVYSGREHVAAGWTPVVREVRDAVHDALRGPLPDARFDAVLLNLYRDGEDAMGWHADDEPELGEAPVIASVSLGAARPMRLRRRRADGWETAAIELPHGSLLVMSGTTQALWQHSLPRRKRVTEPRVNLTFRAVGAKR